MDAEQRSVFQGIVYYYRENMVNCRYQVTLKDAVVPCNWTMRSDRVMNKS